MTQDLDDRPTPWLTLPMFVRARTPAWNRDGTPFDAYVAALVDRPDLSRSHIIGIEGNADMLLAIVSDERPVGRYVAVEPDLVTAAFFASHLERHDVDLMTDDIVVNPDSDVDIAGGAPFDLAIVRAPARKLLAERLGPFLTWLRGVMSGSGQAVVSVALTHATVAGTSTADRLVGEGIMEYDIDYVEQPWFDALLPMYSVPRLETLCAEHGWRLDDVCEPRKGFPHHHAVLSVAD